MWPSMPFEILYHAKQILRLYNVSIHRNFYATQFMNKCARKKKAIIPELWDIEKLTVLITVFIHVRVQQNCTIDEKASYAK